MLILQTIHFFASYYYYYICIIFIPTIVRTPLTILKIIDVGTYLKNKKNFKEK